MKCPITKEPCRSDCAWWREQDEACTIVVIGYVAVAEYNEYLEDKTLQENLYKADKNKLQN